MSRARTATISDQLRAAIAASGLSQAELSRRTGVPQSAISDFLRAAAGLATGSVDRIAAELGLHLAGRKGRRK